MAWVLREVEGGELVLFVPVKVSEVVGVDGS